MKKIFFLLFISSLFFTANAQTISGVTEKFIDSVLNANYSAIEPGAVLLIAEEGKPIYQKVLGMASVELTVPMKEDYVFAIGSMTKQFTAIAILQLVQQGKLNLKDDIKLYMPDYNSHDKIITIENLLTHTAGIPSFTEMDTFSTLFNKDITLKEMVGIFQDAPLMFEPGTDWSYSNSGFNLAGMIIEKVSGMTYEDYQQKNIFDPLKMTSTTLGSKEKIIPRFVNGYQPSMVNYMPASEFSWTWPYAAGQIVSNVNDLLKWDDALYTNKILNQELIQQAFTNYKLSTGEYANYGYGWTVGEYNGVKIIRHGGAINGFLSDAIRIPEKHLYIVMLTNNTKQRPDGVMNEILNKLLHFDITGNAVPIDAEQLKKYTGTYQVNRTGGRLVSNYSDELIYRYFTIDSNNLYAQRTGGAKYKLTYLGNDEFYTTDKFSRIKFGHDAADKSIMTTNMFDVFGNYGPNDIGMKTDIPIPTERMEIELPQEVLQKYEGKYDFGGGFFIKIFIKDNKLFGQATGQGAFEMFAENETEFFLKIVDASITFQLNDAGETIGMTLHQGGDMHAKKVD
ncbi:MAG: serine hydrolase [Chitinophagales bacterium]|nr:serine hydrolase [Chitinophagales bacterium]MBP8752813.1 serine hydrolase [Chitinophagales bacterium]MBP9189489.1 serine hydrolase [Chitinophagales bacterium]MBP9547963.1 serine hydrolase [Chitinophagales bacterium]MBP9703258.1 serine hydrolase [Chitinophagales bacterium]